MELTYKINANRPVSMALTIHTPHIRDDAIGGDTSAVSGVENSAFSNLVCEATAQRDGRWALVPPASVRRRNTSRGHVGDARQDEHCGPGFPCLLFRGFRRLSVWFVRHSGRNTQSCAIPSKNQSDQKQLEEGTCRVWRTCVANRHENLGKNCTTQTCSRKVARERIRTRGER